ncbi:MAG: peptidylprolyl isomerase [Acidimicrobiaceae bacterium]|nr:peptidylprolyl isomerase [Acidimicrobiaceae bacterium]MYH44751.1 peptidylprolyl isomerase [Acidimicrobiaceae bacterium]MYI52677.1 peptidylprolyl isomerase [Acidimicrobiaceae bacterium]
MSTPKRERQRENRRLRLAADEAAAKQYATRRRVKIIGLAAVAVAAALAVLGFLQRDDSETADTVPAPASTGDSADATDAPGTDASGTGNATDPPDTEADLVETAAGCPADDGSSPRVIDFDGPQPMCIDPQARYVAVLDTSEGEMRFELTASETPLTVNNFVTLARWGYYDGTLLFRTDPSIDIIQGGSPHTNDNRDPGPGYTIPDEPAFDFDPETGGLTGPYRYQPGQLVMARSTGPDSAGAQFFLTTGPNTSRLDGQGTYVVFGRTDDAGLAVAQSIIGLHEPGGALGGAPSRDVTVHSVTIEET